MSRGDGLLGLLLLVLGVGVRVLGIGWGIHNVLQVVVRRVDGTGHVKVEVVGFLLRRKSESC